MSLTKKSQEKVFARIEHVIFQEFKYKPRPWFRRIITNPAAILVLTREPQIFESDYTEHFKIVEAALKIEAPSHPTIYFDSDKPRHIRIHGLGYFTDDKEPKTMRIYFVGVHNKRTDIAPLASSTRSGKMIDAIIANVTHQMKALCPFDTQLYYRTNLFDLNHIPKTLALKKATAEMWAANNNVDVLEPTIVILLGNTVHQYFKYTGWKGDTIKLPHPAKPWGTGAKLNYQADAVKKIVSYLHTASQLKAEI